jgi:hypothetical protein
VGVSDLMAVVKVPDVLFQADGDDEAEDDICPDLVALWMGMNSC